MTKREAIDKFGSVKAVAEALGISGPAVSQWPDEIPKLRGYELSEIVAKREECLREAA